MAEAIVTHFQAFDLHATEVFHELVFQTVGAAVYDLLPEEVTTNSVTMIIQRAAEGSRTSATAGT